MSVVMVFWILGWTAVVTLIVLALIAFFREEVQARRRESAAIRKAVDELLRSISTPKQ